LIDWSVVCLVPLETRRRKAFLAWAGDFVFIATDCTARHPGGTGFAFEVMETVSTADVGARWTLESRMASL
jgi:hypothetical protein